MTHVDKARYEQIKKEVTSKRDNVPTHSFDWNIYQGQLDLLTEVEDTFFVPVDMTETKVAVTKQRVKKSADTEEVTETENTGPR